MMSRHNNDLSTERKSTHKKIVAIGIMVVLMASMAIVASPQKQSAFAQQSNSGSAVIEQYILSEQAVLAPLIKSALAPTNVTLPQDLTDIISLGQQLSAKEFQAAANAQNKGDSRLAVRYALAGSDTNIELLRLVYQFEYDNKLPKQAKATEQLIDVLGMASHIQRLDNRIFEITNAAQKHNQTAPDLSNITPLVNNAKQDVQNILNNIGDSKNVEKNINDARKLLQEAGKQLEQIGKSLRQVLKKYERQERKEDQAQDRIHRAISSLTEMANKLQQKAEAEKNADAQSEITKARGYIESAQKSADSGDFKKAANDLREVKQHLEAARALLQK